MEVKSRKKRKEKDHPVTLLWRKEALESGAAGKSAKKSDESERKEGRKEGPLSVQRHHTSLDTKPTRSNKGHRRSRRRRQPRHHKLDRLR
jgi:hypothetical protein